MLPDATEGMTELHAEGAAGDVASIEVSAIEPLPAMLEPPRAALAAARAEVGLPTDRPIVMSGHQAELWHAGILAKLIAAAALAERLDAALVWLVPDQDAHEPTVIPYPAETHEGRLRRREWIAAPDQFVRPGTATCARPAIEPAATPRRARTEWPHARAECGLESMRSALARHASAGNAAAQFTAAALELAEESTGVRGVDRLHASELSRGHAFEMVAARVRKDGAACVRAYNAAVGAHPDAGLRPLEDDELPLWSIVDGAPRRRVRIGDDAEGRLLPRALLLTGHVRRLLCDVWVTGAGGARYDAATRTWLDGWLGETPLAPAVLATATAYLPLREGPRPDPAGAERAAWRLHHAANHPEELGLDSLGAQRDELVSQIDDAPHGSAERSRLFAAMRGVVRDARDAGAQQLAELERERAALKERLRDERVELDRTWPFPLHDPGTLRSLAERIRDAVGAL
ncbi:MAG: hypothetical protein AAFX79_10560 [Planctomycetota bacterium]